MANMITRAVMSAAERFAATSYLWGHTGSGPATDRRIAVADIVMRDGDGAVGIGTGPLANSKLAVQTGAAETRSALNVYHFGDQGNAANQTAAIDAHDYTDGVTIRPDKVGAGTIIRLRLANNAAARPDKPSTYIGTADYIDFQRARISGGGNLGGGNDRLAYINNQGIYKCYGSNGADWDGVAETAPFQAGSYSSFFSKIAYWGWDHVNTEAIFGGIEPGVAFMPLKLACSNLRLLGDNAVDIGRAGGRAKEIFCANGTINTSDGRFKKWRGGLTDEEYVAGKKLLQKLGFYQWLDAINGTAGAEGGLIPAKEGKGDAARYHFGIIAQEAWAIMAEHGLAPPLEEEGERYGVPKPSDIVPPAWLCFDQWEAETRTHFETVSVKARVQIGTTLLGKPKLKTVWVDEQQETDIRVETKPAGNQFGIRPDQFNAFLIAVQARRQTEIEERLAALEGA